jgi:hypothetical protein
MKIGYTGVAVGAAPPDTNTPEAFIITTEGWTELRVLPRR